MIYTYAQSQLLLDVPPVVGPVKRHGVVYTKPWVVELILDMAGYTATEDLGGLVAVEPACGEGSFVVSMVERLVESCRRYGRDIASCGSALVAFELDPETASVSRAAVVRTLVGCGVAQNEAS